jgi:hypothetical protein
MRTPSAVTLYLVKVGIRNSAATQPACPAEVWTLRQV